MCTVIGFRRPVEVLLELRNSRLACAVNIRLLRRDPPSIIVSIPE